MLMETLITLPTRAGSWPQNEDISGTWIKNHIYSHDYLHTHHGDDDDDDDDESLEL